MSDYYSLANADFHSGRPQADAFEEGFRQWKQEQAKSFLQFNSAIAAAGMTAGVTGAFSPNILSYGEKLIGKEINTSLLEAAKISLKWSVGSYILGDIYKSSQQDGSFRKNFASNWSWPHLGLNVALGAIGGSVSTQMFKWAELKTIKETITSTDGIVIRANLLIANKAVSTAGNAAIGPEKTEDKKTKKNGMKK